jgi:hypothetical protein
MIIDMTLPKTFNNWLGFERGFWQGQPGQGAHVPKTSVFGTTSEGFVIQCLSLPKPQKGQPRLPFPLTSLTHPSLNEVVYVSTASTALVRIGSISAPRVAVLGQALSNFLDMAKHILSASIRDEVTLLLKKYCSSHSERHNAHAFAF